MWTAPQKRFALDAEAKNQGYILACSSVPTEDCTIDVSAMELSEDDYLSGDNSQEFVSEIRALTQLTADIWRLRLALQEPTAIEFVAGQFVNVEVPGTNAVRSYSIANAPNETPRWSSYARPILRACSRLI